MLTDLHFLGLKHTGGLSEFLVVDFLGFFVGNKRFCFLSNSLHRLADNAFQLLLELLKLCLSLLTGGCVGPEFTVVDHQNLSGESGRCKSGNSHESGNRH